MIEFYPDFSYHCLIVPLSTVEYSVLLFCLGSLMPLHHVMLDEGVVYGQG